MKKSTRLLLISLIPAFLLASCNDDQTGCDPTRCAKPDNATEMACDADGCFVLSCNTGYRVSDDDQACIPRSHESDCDPAKCQKPTHATEMACDDDGCYVASCEDNYVISPNEDACTAKQSVCIPSECPQPAHAREMACDTDGCFVLACNQGYAPTKDAQSCEQASSQTNPPSGGNDTPTPEVCPVERAKCPKIDESFCCNGRGYLCDYEDWCEGQGLDCPDWSWRSSDCATQKVAALGDRPANGWCDQVGSAFGCVFNLDDEPCTEQNIGHIVYDKRCDSVYNNTNILTCQKLANGKYAYVTKGYATSYCQEGDPNAMISCNSKTNRVEILPCNACKNEFNVFTFHAVCQ